MTVGLSIKMPCFKPRGGQMIQDHPIRLCPGNLNLGLNNSLEHLHSKEPAYCLDFRSCPIFGLSQGLIIQLLLTLWATPDLPRKVLWAYISWNPFLLLSTKEHTWILLSIWMMNNRFPEGLGFNGPLTQDICNTTTATNRVLTIVSELCHTGPVSASDVIRCTH